MTLPEAYRPVVAPPYFPPATSTLSTEFRILDYVRATRKDSRNWWARCPSCAQAGHDRTGDNLAIHINNPPLYTEFRILDYVRATRKDSRNWWARCPSCAQAGHDRTGDNLAIQIKNPRLY